MIVRIVCHIEVLGLSQDVIRLKRKREPVLPEQLRYLGIPYPLVLLRGYIPAIPFVVEVGFEAESESGVVLEGAEHGIGPGHILDVLLLLHNFLGVPSTGSKVERARNASAAAEAGNVFITHNCRNMLAFMDEADLFPYGLHDDTVDGFSGAFNFFRPSALKRIPTGLKKSGGSYWTKFRR